VTDAWLPGLIILGLTYWMIIHNKPPPMSRPHAQVRDPKVVKRYLDNPKGLANRTSGLVQCGGAGKTAPRYRHTQELTVHAQELAVSVAMGKVAIAAHMKAKRQGVCRGTCGIDTIIAGVVRDRKTLKKLEYDQPF
jgi:hypothetical protein